MKENFEVHLDQRAAMIQRQAAIVIQSCSRFHLCRKRFHKLRSASFELQRMIKMWKMKLVLGYFDVFL